MNTHTAITLLVKYQRALREPVLLIESSSLVVATGSLIVSVILDDWSWFQRSGSVMALMGVLDLPK